MAYNSFGLTQGCVTCELLYQESMEQTKLKTELELAADIQLRLLPAGGPAQMLEADGPVMGVLPANMSEEFSLIFKPGDLFAVATYGLSEASSVTGKMFGYGEFLNLVEVVADKTADEILQILYQTMDEFSGEAPQTDDQTLIVVKGIATELPLSGG